LLAAESNATQRPSALIAGTWPAPLAWAPSGPTLTRVVVPVCPSCTKTSFAPFVSPGTSVLAEDPNATQRPSALIAGYALSKFP
jgi:hypothetical protein